MNIIGTHPEEGLMIGLVPAEIAMPKFGGMVALALAAFSADFSSSLGVSPPLYL